MYYINSYISFLFLIASPYVLLAGILCLVWYKWLCGKIICKKIQRKFPKNNDYLREMGYSLITMLVFAAAHSLLLLTNARNYTQFYMNTSQHSSLCFWLVFPLMFIIHDTYFYWTHRLMHHRRLFRYFHLVHHQSVNPSPWAAFAFHPLEAVVEAGIFPVLLITIPLTSVHLYVFFSLMMAYSIYEHLGWELYPKGFSSNRAGKWINTSVSHNLHHQHFAGNYGLYFLFWDRLMNTLRKDYDQKFDKVAGERESKEIIIEPGLLNRVDLSTALIGKV